MGETIVLAGWALLVFALIGALYTLSAGQAVGWFFARPSADVPAVFPPVTILKPLHGDEPSLRAFLEGFIKQDYPAPVQIVFGVRDPFDPAIAVVKALAQEAPDAAIDIVVDDRLYGANLKVSNLVNMERFIRHPFIVLADSDVCVGPDYLRHVIAALCEPEVGFVTCAYVGVATGNFWSNLSAMAINYHFLPSVAFGLRYQMAKPCFGPTIAFRRTVFDQIGGFRPFVDHLADDFEIGRSIRALGYGFAVPPLVIGHGCPERSCRSVVSHELRWARTIRMIDPMSYAGSVVCHPLPWALSAAVLLHGAWPSLAALALVVLARVFVMIQIGRVDGGKAGRWWLAPGRDLLSVGVFLCAYLSRNVRWRGRRFRIEHNGGLSAVPIDRRADVRPVRLSRSWSLARLTPPRLRRRAPW